MKSSVPAAQSPDQRQPRTLPEILAAYERVIILKALGMAGGSRTRAAESLGIRRKYLYRRIRRLQIDLGQICVRIGRPRKIQGERR